MLRQNSTDTRHRVALSRTSIDRDSAVCINMLFKKCWRIFCISKGCECCRQLTKSLRKSGIKSPDLAHKRAHTIDPAWRASATWTQWEMRQVYRRQNLLVAAILVQGCLTQLPVQTRERWESQADQTDWIDTHNNESIWGFQGQLSSRAVLLRVCLWQIWW